jgi:hypothetical protein
VREARRSSLVRTSDVLGHVPLKVQLIILEVRVAGGLGLRTRVPLSSGADPAPRGLYYVLSSGVWAWPASRRFCRKLEGAYGPRSTTKNEEEWATGSQRHT